MPYGGAIEIEAFVRLECLGNFTVRVWAAPGDPLCAAATGHNEFLHIATYGVGDEVIDLSLKNLGTWAAHYELLEFQVAGSPGVSPGADGGAPSAPLGGTDGGDAAAAQKRPASAPDPSLFGSSSDDEGGRGAGGAYDPKRARGAYSGVMPNPPPPPRGPRPAPTHESGADRGRYTQGMGTTGSPFKHSPAHTGFSRANAIANGFAWVASVMDDDEWMEPPVDHLLDYVPVGARPLFAEQFREMLWWLERDSRNEARWFLLLRAWPVLGLWVP
eukprot:COSAG06_NODE_15534_length_1063_cov_3.820539_1_plen_273_part_00